MKVVGVLIVRAGDETDAVRPAIIGDRSLMLRSDARIGGEVPHNVGIVNMAGLR